MDTLRSVMDMIVNFVTFGGSLWLVWGVVILAGGLKDKNGPALQSGLWQIVGGGLIVGAAQVFGRLALPTLAGAVWALLRVSG
ncbi:MAG: hypothetical protein LBQ16_01160 [Gracilibacteraceae bacterium]|jgi:hypothetical protein|nr:hypothetical protein [Gracilibacteraceae bacterium]